MTFRVFSALALVLALSACGGKDKSSDAPAPAAPPVLDFNALAGIPEFKDAQNVCPYAELEGSYKVSSSACSLGGKEVEIDTVLTPTRYIVTQMSGYSGTIEIQFTQDGAERAPEALDFPRIQTVLNSKRQGVQCGADSEKGVFKLFQACTGTNVSGSCFYSIVKKGNKIFAVTSRLRNGLQYWCKSNLREVTPWAAPPLQSQMPPPSSDGK